MFQSGPVFCCRLATFWGFLLSWVFFLEFGIAAFGFWVFFGSLGFGSTFTDDGVLLTLFGHSAPLLRPAWLQTLWGLGPSWAREGGEPKRRVSKKMYLEAERRRKREGVVGS